GRIHPVVTFQIQSVTSDIIFCFLIHNCSVLNFLFISFSAALAPFLNPSTKLSKQALWISKVHLRISGQIEHFWLSLADFLAIFVTFFIGFLN
ncbi:hypothetical protein, partial [Phocaeicola dorei]|uniref:hypothetical protein n=1 Tax=Phocaeicola dorei TaxID=357276 RepID=UPI0032ECCA39